LSGSGAHKVRITYYDDNVNGPFAETVFLSGTGAVNTNATNMRYIEKMEVTEVGSTGWNLGTISLFTAPSGSGGTIGSIGFGNIVSTMGDGETLWAHHYVKNILTSSITGISAGSNGNQEAIVHLRTKSLVTGSSPELIASDLITVAISANSVVRPYTSPIKILGPARIVMYVISVGTNQKYVGAFDFTEE
jgi:hypothetical protein